MAHDNTTDIPVGEAVEDYLDATAVENADQTVQAHKYRLGHFVRFCEQTFDDPRTTGDITPPLLFEYRRWRKQDGDLNLTSLHTQLSTLRVFMGWCEDRQYVREGMKDAVDVPSLERSGKRTTLDYERGQRIRQYLRRYEYASFDHVLMALLVSTGIRIGAVYCLDVGDVDTDDRLITFHHRPDTDTPLKNKHNGQRVVGIDAELAEAVDDYVAVNRIDTVDSHGREPLLTTEHGRPNISWLRRVVYRCTQPCLYTECPHDRLEVECPDVGYGGSGCPSSRPPHDVRRGVVTHYRREDIPAQAIVERANVSLDVLDKHYDVRSETERAEQRKEHFDI